MSPVENPFGLPILSTAGSGFFFGGWLFPGPSSTSVSWNNVLNDQLRGLEFILPIGFVVRKACIKNLAAGPAGAKVICGIYDAFGNLQIDTGQFDGTITASVQSLTLASPVTLFGGFVYRYVWAIHANNSTCTSDGAFAANDPALNQNSSRIFTAANAYSGTAMPATLGALTVLTGVTSIPVCLFEP